MWGVETVGGIAPKGRQGKRRTRRTAHVVLLRTLDHTGSEELLMNVLEPRICAALRGMETVGETPPWG